MTDELPAAYLRGIEQFNAGEFFACHETWEPLWQAAAGEERMFLHALIQAAVAFHHWQRGNRSGARSVARRAQAKLAQSPAQVMRLKTKDFATSLAAFFAISEPQDSPSYPTIELHHDS